MVTEVKEWFDLAKTRSVKLKIVDQELPAFGPRTAIPTYKTFSKKQKQDVLIGEIALVDLAGKRFPFDVRCKSRELLFDANTALVNGTRLVAETDDKIIIVSETPPTVRQITARVSTGFLANPLFMDDGKYVRSPVRTVGLIAKDWEELSMRYNPMKYYTTELSLRLLYPRFLHVFCVKKRHTVVSSSRSSIIEHSLRRKYFINNYNFVIKGPINTDTELFIPPLAHIDTLGRDLFAGHYTTAFDVNHYALGDIPGLLDYDFSRFMTVAREIIFSLWASSIRYEGKSATLPVLMGYCKHPVFDSLEVWQDLSNKNPEAITEATFIPLTATAVKGRVRGFAQTYPETYPDTNPSAVAEKTNKYLGACLESYSKEAPLTLGQFIEAL